MHWHDFIIIFGVDILRREIFFIQVLKKYKYENQSHKG